MLRASPSWHFASDPLTSTTISTNWSRKIRVDLPTVTRPSQPTDNNGMYADLETSRLIARVTLWESGESDWEVLSISTGETIFWDHCALQTPASLDQRLDEFCTRLTYPDTQP